jgi:putative ABC transport system substrate-binding protein
MPDPKCEIFMKRGTKILIIVLCLSILVQPPASEAQQPGRVYRIGYLAISPDNYETDTHNCPIGGTPYWQSTMAGLHERGYVQGRNLVLECRYSENRFDRALALAAELLSLEPDLMLVVGTGQARAAQQATRTIPIVMYGVIDPVWQGLVPSLARPGGNLTGLTDTPTEMEGKRLQLLKEITPGLARVAILGPSAPLQENWTSKHLEPAARSLGLSLRIYAVVGEDFADAFEAMVKAGEEALFVLPTPQWNTRDFPQRIAALATLRRLPSIGQDMRFVQAGGLMSYSADAHAFCRRIGFYVDKILKGANPGDLPVEQPTKFNLVINRRTATALGLSIPQSLLLMADEVID